MPDKKIGVAVFWAVFISVVCLMNFNEVPQVNKINIPHLDKMVHFVLYSIFAILCLWSINSNQQFLKKAVGVFLFCVAFGILIECLQDYFTTTRSAELLDVLANTFGVVSGILLTALFKNKNKTSPL